MRPVKDSGVSISLILPAWNESDAILRAIEEADAALRQVSADFEIIVVDDGSTDNTAELVKQAAVENHSLRLVQHNSNQGYGAALRSGFAEAKKDLVGFTDADCQFDLTELNRFVLLAERYDIVCGYRIDRKDTALRCLYSKVYNQLVGVLLRTGVRDVDCALKLFHRKDVQELEISGNGFLVNSEILTQAKQRGMSVVEVGVSHRRRIDGQSTVSIAHIPKVLSSLARYWWNVVQFPPLATLNSGGKPPLFDVLISDRRAGWMQWVLLLIAAVFMLTNLGYPLIDRDETRYAEIPREMLATGNWILPQLNFETYYDKPPLMYWLCACSFSLFGVNETAARLVPAIASLAMIATTMWFGSRNFGKQVGLLSGGVLMLSVGFAFTSRYLLLDGVLAMLVACSLFTAYEAIRSDRLKLRWWIASAVFCGLAFLTKGPLAFVLWLPSVFAFTWLSSSNAKPRLWHYSLFAGVVALIVLPWVVAVSLQDPTFVVEFLYKHNIQRFAGEFHRRPIWYFIPVLLVAGHPWSFLAAPYVKFLFGHSGEVRFQRPPVVGFLLIWSAWCFVFFSLSSCKLPTYLLPAAPALALMIGHYLGYVLSASSHDSQHWTARFWAARLATAATCVAGVSFVAFVVATGIDTSFTMYFWALLWTVLLVSAVIMLRDRHQAEHAWASSSALAFLFAGMVMHQTIPAYSRSQTMFGIESSLTEFVAAESKPAIATIAHEFSEVPFYLNRTDIRNFKNFHEKSLHEFLQTNGRSILVVKSEVAAKDLWEELPTGATIRSLSVHGPAQIVEVALPKPSARLAEQSTERNTK